ncbi:MAG: hypothetical protein KH434_05685 [Clostridium sp.]|nr:hypothetical protein [Clostridium sp.]
MKQQDILNRTSIINVKNKLGLEEIYSKKDIIYVKCPFCHSDKGTMRLNISNNSYICKKCEARGYSIGLYAKNKYISNKEAYKILINDEADMSNNLMSTIITNVKRNKEEVDIVYQAFLEKLSLSSNHVMKLLKYGFTMEEIEKIGFKTIPIYENQKIEICRQLQEEGINLSGIPGFFKDKKFRWNFKSHKGIFIPIQDNGKIIALRIHLDPAYSIDTTDIWFSSSQENEGTKIDNHIMIIFPENNIIKVINNIQNVKNIIIASEMILAYKLASKFKDTIIVGVPNVLAKNEISKLNIIKDVEKVYLVMDFHTVLHNSENLLSNIYKIYDEDKIKLSISLKDLEIPIDLEEKVIKEESSAIKKVA